MTISRVDLTEANGYILEEQGSTVIQDLIANSAVERFARREAMASRTKSVPRFVGDAPVVVAEGAEIPASNPTLDEIVLTARKYAQLMHISEEDVNDSLVDTLSVYKREWASRFARKFDNACLGVTAAGDGDDGQPYTSLYRAVATSPTAPVSQIIQTGGAMSYDDLNNALGFVENSKKFDSANTVWMAHPKMLKEIRGMVKGNSDLVLPDPLAGTPGSLFGYPLVISYGAATSTAATDSPTGNALLIVGNRQMLINGVRGGVESVVSRDAEFARDGVVLKTRVRRGFAVADADAFAIVEKTGA
ncbi:major_cap_HK97, phage major capsid protein, HK97 family [uncultured Caudovirales phage]|uniref:Major_cap_HK97, phage major capsid protein, HK97 family n=1 Tax=uncultured Caudovirales phage TaxID=2100421 RepID=A0A6J5NMH9_9CAUD|nr:major_cap_HK97, phage major capsid protein, HK97 family [uncultured Caudovirales phage]